MKIIIIGKVENLLRDVPTIFDISRIQDEGL